MENEARFNLNKALQDWKAELATQPGIGAENIRELETHLLESIAAFKKRGCSDDAAFSLAKQKLGSAQQLGTEFAKENLLKVWRDRVFWITAVLLFLQLTKQIVHTLFEKLAPVKVAHGLAQSSAPLVFLLVFVVMKTGFAEVIFRKLHWIFARRWRLAVTGVIAILGTHFVATMSPDLRQAIPGWDIFEFAFLAFAVFILPREFPMVSGTTRSACRRNSITLWRDRLFWVVLSSIAVQIWALVLIRGSQAIVREKALANSWWVWGAFLSVWLLTWLAVALMLASARLSVLDRWLRTRGRVAFIGGALGLLWGGLSENWSQFQYALLGTIICAAVLDALVLVAMPSRRAQQQEDALKFE